MGHATSITSNIRVAAPHVVDAGTRAFSPAEAATAVAAWKTAKIPRSHDALVKPPPDTEGDDAEYPPFDCVVAGGGDGTLREVVSGLEHRSDGAGKRIPVVGLPIGTGNSTMRDARVFEPLDTLRAILGGQMHGVDAFEVLHSGAAEIPPPPAATTSEGGAEPERRFADTRPRHGVVIDEAALDAENGAISLPGRLIGVNVISVLAATDATLFAERNRWLGGLRYDAGGVASLLALSRYRLSVHFSGHRLPATYPLSEPDESVHVEETASGDIGAAADAAASGDTLITVEAPDSDADGLPRRRYAPAAAGEVEDADVGVSGGAKDVAAVGSEHAESIADELPLGHPVSDAGMFALFVQNSRTSGKALEVTPASKLDDGLLDIMFMRRLSRVSLFRAFNLLKSGAHSTLPDLDLLQCKSLLMSHCDAFVPGLEDGGTSAPGAAEHAAHKAAPGGYDDAPRLMIIVDGDVKVLTPVLVRALPRAWCTMVVDPAKTPALP